MTLVKGPKQAVCVGGCATDLPGLLVDRMVHIKPRVPCLLHGLTSKSHWMLLARDQHLTQVSGQRCSRALSACLHYLIIACLAVQVVSYFF